MIEDPAVIGAYTSAVVAVLTAVLTGLNLSGRLREETTKRKELEEKLDLERSHRYECMQDLARLRATVTVLERAMRNRNML